MTLSIITINRNNACGLEKTMQSVLSQNCQCFEYVVVDGASVDGSLEVIQKFVPAFGERLKWVSEPDNGIYQAMNKGMKMASGEYIQILNSGDKLAADDVTSHMLEELDKKGKPSILYGNEIKQYPDGKRIVDKGFMGKEITMFGLFSGTLNHDAAYIKADLFKKYGYYDEAFKIVSDWKWFLQAIVFGGEKPVYTDVIMTIDDMTGISETNLTLRNEERQRVLRSLVPGPILSDYEQYSFQINQINRLMRHPWAYKMAWFLERCLFKWEKWFSRQNHTIGA